MNSLLDAIRDFLESIPQFISDLEPDTDYLKVPGGGKTLWKALDKYNIEENEKGDGFVVSGRLAVPLVDLIHFPGWHNFLFKYSDLRDDKAYELYLNENPHLVSEFNLEEFCENFVDFYCDFLNDSGIEESELELDVNSIRLLGSIERPDDDLDTDINEDDDSDEDYSDMDTSESDSDEDE